MKAVFVINESMSHEQLEQSYLLILALLNFDHHVDLVFVGDAFNQLIQGEQTTKKWRALKLYGVHAFYQFCDDKENHPDELVPLNANEFATLKTQAQFLS